MTRNLSYRAFVLQIVQSFAADRLAECWTGHRGDKSRLQQHAGGLPE